MAIPAFPSQDLAKLVLGYLAEEQLMTAYDEFLQASPYLDALRNEYDRIFMTSLRNILAEYRAVKIYVETCKPFALRKRLFQCTNLMEIVKYLIQNIDMSKVHMQDENSARNSSETRNSSIESKQTGCETCTSLKLVNCVCKSRQSSTVSVNVQSSSNMDITLESSVETTALEDLPGNHVTTRKNHVKVLKETTVSQSNTCEQPNADLIQQSDGSSTVSLDHNLSSRTLDKNHDSAPQGDNVPKLADIESTQSVEEKNEIGKNNVTESSCNNTGLGVCSRVSTATTFQDFATGVRGSENVHSNVPDSSTSENYCIQASATKEMTPNTQEIPKGRILLKVGTIRNSKPNEVINVTEQSPGYLQIRPKDPKITILSDIKVDKSDKNQAKIPGVLKNATSTPLVQMQTIMINGTPAYKHDPKTVYTKDEIMAMPTIILVPKPGPSKIPSITSENRSTTTQNTTKFSRKICCIPPTDNLASQNSNLTTEDIKFVTKNINSTSENENVGTVPSNRSLEPLIIDVSNSPVSSNINATNLETNKPIINPHKDANEPSMLVKTVDLKNASVPKDNVIEGHKTNTPQMLPPTRKSSSTPRRTSHVRVLDFTTPRRILQEPINENVAENGDVDVIVSRSPNLHTFIEEASGETGVVNNLDIGSNINGSTKENNSTKTASNKSNWDADLRTHAIANANVSVKKPKPKTVKKKKLSLDKKEEDDKKDGTKSSVKRKSTKSKKAKLDLKSDEVLDDSLPGVAEPVSLPVKPTINIITDWSTPDDNKNPKISEKSDELVETPETERLALQNAIEAKLNISDFLATPYKQALYDIQMETPRFLGPDLPDEPMSDIKIMNIPTPRFLDTPKPQSTPSYSSRPTDYSSGGSYYKPDDQDYTVPEDLGYTLPAKEKPKLKKFEADVPSEKETKEKRSVKSRPVRKCTKNVSYYNSPIVGNKKEIDDRTEVTSTCSETMSVNSSEGKKDKESVPKTVKDKSKTHTKTENKKRNNTTKIRKTPIKKETPKTFMKIKPRRPTPTKESLTGNNKRKLEPKIRKRTNSKEKHNATPAVVCAPTKSRRKSSTPRKLHCTKQFNSESSGHESPDTKTKQTSREISSCAPDSDTDHLALRWSDDGSQDGKPKESQTNISNDPEDISKIRAYIASCDNNKTTNTESSLHDDLVKRGFDIETAKIIERDLLDTPPQYEESTVNVNYETTAVKTLENIVENPNVSDCSTANLQIDQDEEEEIELSIQECNEESDNYITCQHDYTKETQMKPPIKLKDTFNMEVCIDDGVTVRVRATPFTLLLDEDPIDVDRPDYSYKETEAAVSSISNIEHLYTPMKDSIKATCYEIFDSTLTSLDTPLKVQSPKRRDVTVTEIYIEGDKDDKKRKRLRSNSSEESVSENKRAKAEAEYFKNQDLHNIDIETVLCKLHGP